MAVNIALRTVRKGMAAVLPGPAWAQDWQEPLALPANRPGPDIFAAT